MNAKPEVTVIRPGMKLRGWRPLVEGGRLFQEFTFEGPAGRSVLLMVDDEVMRAQGISVCPRGLESQESGPGLGSLLTRIALAEQLLRRMQADGGPWLVERVQLALAGVVPSLSVAQARVVLRLLVDEGVVMQIMRAGEPTRWQAVAGSAGDVR